LAKGIGKRPPVGSKIWYHYVAYLDEGMEPYDQSLGRNAESFILGGTPEIIPGLLIGLETMELKEISQFVVSPEYAYGKLGCPPRIPKGLYIVRYCTYYCT
jgi:FK506-binding protein 6